MDACVVRLKLVKPFNQADYRWIIRNFRLRTNRLREAGAVRKLDHRTFNGFKQLLDLHLSLGHQLNVALDYLVLYYTPGFNIR
ncbi:hypothetical protein D3C75_637270 [compost metagenome]